MENQTPAIQVQNNPQLQPSSSFPKKTVLLIIVIILLLLSTAYNLYLNSKLKQTVSSNQSVPTPTTATLKTQNLPSQTDETANWKTFTDPSGKISFKYPSSWYYQDDSNYGGASPGSSYGFYLEGVKADPAFGDHRGNEVFVFSSTKGTFSITDLMKNNKDAQEFKVGNIIAIKAATKAPAFIIQIPTEDRLIHLGFASKEGQANSEKILSTFKFLK